ncbi:MAG: heavy metal-responsive transcriptional regulator [Stagnimonas sp.]|nr:heavy metal-responsive transcriptional regulator [Stagnimonas sp.]
MPKTLMTIGAAAKSAGVAVDTVRYYEREGLLASATRTASGYRVFAAADVERLRFIRKAKTLGFTLADIAELLRLQDGGGPRTEVRQRARSRIEDLSRKIAALTATVTSGSVTQGAATVDAASVAMIGQGKPWLVCSQAPTR